MLEHVTIEPKVTIDEDPQSKHFGIPEHEICEWAYHTSQHFGKTITVVQDRRAYNTSVNHCVIESGGAPDT